MKAAIFFLVGLVVSSVGLSQLATAKSPTPVVEATKQVVVLGHRIGPNGSEMLVIK